MTVMSFLVNLFGRILQEVDTRSTNVLRLLALTQKQSRRYRLDALTNCLLVYSCVAIQRDLNRLEKWAEKKVMKFNKDKCKVLLLGRNNPVYEYKMGTTGLKAFWHKKTWRSW